MLFVVVSTKILLDWVSIPNDLISLSNWVPIPNPRAVSVTKRSFRIHIRFAEKDEKLG